MKTIYYVLAILVLFLASCTTTSYTLDDKPDVCSEYERSRIVNTARLLWQRDQTSYDRARTDWLRSHNNSLEGFNGTAPAPFSEPTGFNVITHVLVHKPSGGLFRNQTFNILIHPIDEGADIRVLTDDAKASTELRYSFTSLNEVEISITPVVNASYIPTTISVRKFIPCQDTWFNDIDYDLKKNYTSTADEFDVPKLLIEGDIGRVNEDHPEIISPGDVLVLLVKIPESGSDHKLAVEYNRAQVQKVELKYKGETVPLGILPFNESVSANGNAEQAFGPLTHTGDYELIVFADGSTQPTNKIQLKLFDGDELIRAGDVFFIAKSAIVPGIGIVDYTELTVAFVAGLVILMLVLRVKK